MGATESRHLRAYSLLMKMRSFVFELASFVHNGRFDAIPTIEYDTANHARITRLFPEDATNVTVRRGRLSPEETQNVTTRRGRRT